MRRADDDEWRSEADLAVPPFSALVALSPRPPAATTAVADFVVFDALWRVDEEQATGRGGVEGVGEGSFKMFVA